MDTTNYSQFFEQRLELARWIVTDKGKDFEADAEIILCSAIGALASKLWPGTGIDRQRFTELLVNFSSSKVDLRIISTPVLAWQLRSHGDLSSAIDVAKHFFPGHPKEVLEPTVVDQDESVIITAFNHLDKKTIRQASYASIIYRDLRCGLIHEYDISEPITPVNLFEIYNSPSYLNMSYANGQNRRLLHIPFEFLVNVLSSITESLFTYWSIATKWEKPHPSNWWVDS